MSSESYKRSLIRRVIEESDSKEWAIAVQEWDITDCYEDEQAESSCVCGHERIRYCFTITNRKNGNVIHPIGSECIKKFGRVDLREEILVHEKMFKLIDAQKRGEYIEFDSRFFSRKVLKYLYEQKAFGNGDEWEAEREYKFALDMFNKRDKSLLTERQERRARGIIAYSIKPFIARKLHLNQ